MIVRSSQLFTACAGWPPAVTACSVKVTTANADQLAVDRARSLNAAASGITKNALRTSEYAPPDVYAKAPRRPTSTKGCMRASARAPEASEERKASRTPPSAYTDASDSTTKKG